MDNRQGRKTGWTIIGCGCVFIILSKLWIGLLMAALGILLICIAGRCPHCGKILLLVSQRHAMPQMPQAAAMTAPTDTQRNHRRAASVRRSPVTAPPFPRRDARR